METIKQFLKVLALVLWFIGIFSAVIFAGPTAPARPGRWVSVNLVSAGLFCWFLADYLH